MTISMYQASVPVFIRYLNNLAGILEKAAAHAEEKKIDPSVLINSRLFPDMFPLARQVYIATDMAKGCVARLAGQEPPKYDDVEVTFPDLVARINKTVAFLETFKPEQIDGTEGKSVTLPTRSGPKEFVGLPYLLGFVQPNFYFHITTTYNILRHNGLDIGKQDYLGQY